MQVLGKAKPHFGQAPGIAADRDESRIGLDESVFNGAGGEAEQLLEIGKFRRDFHRAARLAHRLEIGARRLARAGAVAIPFIEDKPGSRHQIEHRRNDAAFQSRRRSGSARRRWHKTTATTAMTERRDRIGPACSAAVLDGFLAPSPLRGRAITPGKQQRTQLTAQPRTQRQTRYATLTGSWTTPRFDNLTPLVQALEQIKNKFSAAGSERGTTPRGTMGIGRSSVG